MLENEATANYKTQHDAYTFWLSRLPCDPRHQQHKFSSKLDGFETYLEDCSHINVKNRSVTLSSIYDGDLLEKLAPCAGAITVHNPFVQLPLHDGRLIQKAAYGMLLRLDRCICLHLS